MDKFDLVMNKIGHQIFTTYADGETIMPATDSLISRFEEEIGCPLPLEYRSFLKRYGGAYLTNVVAKLSSASSRLSSHFHLGLGFFFAFYSDNGPGDLFYNYRNLRSELVPGMIPIGETDGDVPFCISCAKQSYGHIYLCMHEFGEGPALHPEVR